MKSENHFRNFLRILGTIAFLLYFLFLIFEGVPLFKATNFADISVYLLFLLFLIAYFFLWRNELLSGILVLAWYGLQWLLVYTIWEDGGMTLIIGFPIALMGVMIMIFGIRKKISHN